VFSTVGDYLRNGGLVKKKKVGRKVVVVVELQIP
jgi:hypothetical protein